jgi:hypothetical protein
MKDIPREKKHAIVKCFMALCESQHPFKLPKFLQFKTTENQDPPTSPARELGLQA